jgi:hypothetical protein
MSEIIQLQNENYTIRYDTELAFNALAFKKSFTSDASLIFSTLYYIAYKFQHYDFNYHFINNNLHSKFIQTTIDFLDKENFRMIQIDASELSRLLNIKRSNLLANHPFPQYLIDEFSDLDFNYKNLETFDVKKLYNFICNTSFYNRKNELKTNQEKADTYLKKNQEKEVHKRKNKSILLTIAQESLINQYKDKYTTLYGKDKVHYNSYLDNALYKAANYKLRFLNHTEKTNYHVGATGGTELFKSFEKFVDKKNKNKIFYIIHITKSFEKNLNRYFIIKDISIINQLKKHNIEILSDYVRSSYSIATNHNQKYFYSTFNTLKDVLNINIQKVSDIKYKINEYFKKLNEIDNISVDLRWIKKDNQKHAYTPVLHFDLEKNKNLNNYENRNKAFLNELRHILIKYFISAYKENNQNKFEQWLKTKEDYQYKIKTFDTLFIQYYPKTKESKKDFFKKQFYGFN